jgi:hypothetical protein
MRILFLFLVLLLSVFSHSQNKQLLYGFSEIPQSLLQNPGGEVSNSWYFGIPLLSHIHFNGGVKGSTVYKAFADNGVDFNVKFRNAVDGMKVNDFISFNQQLEIFSGGFSFGNSYEKNEYLSFGMYQELDFIMYFPQDYVVLALEGNQNNINRMFDASDLNVAAQVTSVLHVGYNKKVNEKFTYGIRGKIYSSLADVKSTNNKGSFVTVPGENGYYDHIFNLDLELQTSGIASLIDDENSDVSNDVDEFKKRLLFGGNLGLGVDFGFTYKVGDQWTLDASLLDVGFINHTKDVENYSISGNYTYSGLNPLFSEAENGQSAEEYWGEIEDDFEALFDVDTTNTKYTKWRPVKFNASLNYAFGEKQSKTCNCAVDDTGYINAIGLQLYGISRPRRPQMALTAYYYRRLFNALRLKATYTVDSYTFNNLGLGMSAHIGGANFYVMVDNLLEYKNVYDAQSLSLQLGFNYIFNKK